MSLKFTLDGMRIELKGPGPYAALSMTPTKRDYSFWYVGNDMGTTNLLLINGESFLTTKERAEAIAKEGNRLTKGDKPWPGYPLTDPPEEAA